MKKPTHIIYGFITGVFIILLVTIVYLTKIDLSGNIQVGVLCGFIISGVFASCKSFKKLNQNANTKEVFFNGFRTTAIIALLLIGFGVLVLNIFPSIKNNQIAIFKTQLLNESKVKLDKQTFAALDSVKNDTFKIMSVKDNAIVKEKENIILIEKDTTQYKNKFITMFIGINMMIVVISGLVGSAIGAILNKNK